MTVRASWIWVVSLLLACQTAHPSAAPPAPAASFEGGYPDAEAGAALRDELLYTRAVQAYLWALPLINLYGMKEGSEQRFGKGYHLLPIWKRRLDSRTLITTPNSDVIYAMGYLDLKQDGPLVIEVPPGLQGILDDFFQRPICSETKIAGKIWCGDVGLPGPDKGKGGKYLLLPPDWKGRVPYGYFPYRSRTYGVFVFWRGFFQDPEALEGPVDVMEKTRIYPLNKKSSARSMEFPDVSGLAVTMLPPRDIRAFEMLKEYVDHEYVDPRDLDMRGLLAGIGIVPDEPFAPSEHDRAILERAAARASEMGRYLAIEASPTRDGARYYPDRQWINPFPPNPGNPEFVAPTYTDLDLRSGFFSLAYSASPGMAIDLPDVGAKYPFSFRDANGEYLRGDRAYRLHLPAGIPAKLFWSVTVYDAENASGLANGQRFPSINQMDEPAKNADGSIDIDFGPTRPGEGKNWLATVPGKGFFVILRLYGPTKAFYDKSWKPGDLERVQ